MPQTDSRTVDDLAQSVDRLCVTVTRLRDQCDSLHAAGVQLVSAMERLAVVAEFTGELGRNLDESLSAMRAAVAKAEGR